MQSEIRKLYTKAETAQIAVCKAAFTKNGAEAYQPIWPEIVPVLRDFLRKRPKGRPVWPGSWIERASRMLKRDLRRARRAWIKEARTEDERQERMESDFLIYKDGEGRYADFHALRVSYATWLALGNVHPRMAQQLLRHSTIDLTMNVYTKLRLHDVAVVVHGLPPLFDQPQDRREASG